MVGMARRVGNVAFKALTAGLGVATIYLTVTFSVNCYRGFSWHSAQSIRSYVGSSVFRFIGFIGVLAVIGVLAGLTGQKLEKEKPEE